MGGYWGTLEDLGIDRHGTDRHILVALQPYAFHAVKKEIYVEGAIILL